MPPDDHQAALEHSEFRNVKSCPHCGARNLQYQSLAVRQKSFEVIDITESPTEPVRFQKVAEAHSNITGHLQKLKGSHSASNPSSQVIPTFGNRDRSKVVRAVINTIEPLPVCAVTVLLVDIMQDINGDELSSEWHKARVCALSVIVQAYTIGMFRAEIRRTTFTSLDDFIVKDLLYEGYKAGPELDNIVQLYQFELAYSATPVGSEYRIIALGTSTQSVRTLTELLAKFEKDKKNNGAPAVFVIGRQFITDLSAEDLVIKRENEVNPEAQAVEHKVSSHTVKSKAKKATNLSTISKIKAEIDATPTQQKLTKFSQHLTSNDLYESSDSESLPELTFRGYNTLEEEIGDQSSSEVEDVSVRNAKTRVPRPQAKMSAQAAKGKRERSVSNSTTSEPPAACTRAKKPISPRKAPKRLVTVLYSV
jgi:hypothetical protein